MFMCSWQQGEANFLFGVSQYSIIELIRIVQIHTQGRSPLWCSPLPVFRRESWSCISKTAVLAHWELHACSAGQGRRKAEKMER